MCTVDFDKFDSMQKLMMVQALKQMTGVYVPLTCKQCGADAEQYNLDLSQGILIIEHVDHTKSPCELRFIIEGRWFEV